MLTLVCIIAFVGSLSDGGAAESIRRRLERLR